MVAPVLIDITNAIGGPKALIALLHAAQVNPGSGLQISENSLRFDMPAGVAKDDINQVKLTRQPDGKYRVTLRQIIEIDLIADIPAPNLAGAVETFTGIKFTTTKE